MQAQQKPRALSYAIAASAAMTSLATFHITYGVALSRAIAARRQSFVGLRTVAPEPAADAVSEPVAKEIFDRVEEAIEAPVATETAEPVTEEVVELAVEPIQEPVAEPSPEPVAATPSKAAAKPAKPAPDKKPDDLTMIKGLGPKIQAELNSHGIRNFQQIAEWTADQVAWFDTNLGGIRGSVSRGGWVDQAKQLAKHETV